jgi:hypothetical protein
MREEISGFNYDYTIYQNILNLFQEWTELWIVNVGPASLQYRDYEGNWI